MTGYGKSDLMECIAELEERISELARENAELKQVPRCPLRDSMTGEMGACDPQCGLLMKRDDTGQYRVCAGALAACELLQGTWVPANYWNEMDE